MELVRLKSGEYDDVPSDKEWHMTGHDAEFTVCGLACLVGGTSAEIKTKEGKFRQVTCQHCRRIVKHYKELVLD